ncbi:MAG: hypothetical protein IH621_08965 [Krumholzibacteria bacterium]|nr:hypothetical protein [Candidatus Krumholzibacteria bacterium]
MTNRPVRFSQLSPAWRTLVRQMQRLNYGTMSNIQNVDGEPVLDAGFQIVASYRFRAENNVRPERSLSDFLLPKEILWLIEIFETERSCRVARLEVRGGLPTEVDVEAAA